MKSEIIIVEVGLWEGFQYEDNYIPVHKKVELIKRISGAGIKKIIATSFAHPKSFPQFIDSEHIMKCLNYNPSTAYLAAVPNEVACRRALASDVKEVVVWVSSSETHNRKSLNVSVADTLKEIQLISKICKENDVSIRPMIATAFGCIYEGGIPVTVVEELALKLNKLGCADVCLTDSHGVANPKEVRKRLGYLKKELPHITFGVHFHDVRGMGMANVYAALEEDIKMFDAAVGGIGMAPDMPQGSLDITTEDLVFMLEEMGISTGIDLDKLSYCTDFAEEIIGRRLRRKTRIMQ